MSLIAIAPRELTLVKSVSEGPKICYKGENKQLVWKQKCYRLLSNWFFEIELLSHLIKILKHNKEIKLGNVALCLKYTMIASIM